MKNIIGVMIPNGDFQLDKTAIYMPITVHGKPIGFISGVDDKRITACLWTKDWAVKQDENNNVMQIELMNGNLEDLLMEGLE